MSIDETLNRPFVVDGMVNKQFRIVDSDGDFVIEYRHSSQSEKCWAHFANIANHNQHGFAWYTFVMGTSVDGNVIFDDMYFLHV